MKIGRDPRKTASANLLGSERRAGKVDQRSRALRLPATTHLRCVPNEHPCMLEPAPRALLSLTYSPPRTIGAFGRIAGKWWLQQLVGMQQRSQHASMPAAVRVVSMWLLPRSRAQRCDGGTKLGSDSVLWTAADSRAGSARCTCAAEARSRHVRMRSGRLRALSVRPWRVAHGTVRCVHGRCRCG